jgi:hypothetical protein
MILIAAKSNFKNPISYDDLAKNRYSRAGGDPDTTKVIQKTGFSLARE